MIYTNMKKLIANKFYKTKEEAQEKLDVFFMVGKLTPSEYSELTLLVEEVYAPSEPSVPVEPIV